MVCAVAGPLPTLDGITSMEPKKPMRRPPPTLIPPIPMFPIVREEQVQKAKRKFNEAGPTNGSLTGAFQIFGCSWAFYSSLLPPYEQRRKLGMCT